MNIRMIARSLLIGAAFGLLPVGAANAGSIFTPALFKGSSDQIVCIATNVTAASIHVSVKIWGVLGNAAQTCTLAPHDAGGCQAFRNGDAGYCQIFVGTMTDAQVAASLRGVLLSRKTMAPFTVEASVAAR